MQKTIPIPNETTLIRNSLQFHIPDKKIETGLYFKEKKHLKRLRKKHFESFCHDKDILENIEEFIWLDTRTDNADALFSFKLNEIPYLARWYYEYQCYLILKKHLRITRQSFIGAYQYWTETISAYPEKYLAFEKFNLYFDISEAHDSIYISITYEGISKVLLKHTEELVNSHQMDTLLLSAVIYEKECQPFRRIPDEIRLQPNKVYPILGKEIADYLSMAWEFRKDLYPLHTAMRHIQNFYDQLMKLDEMQSLFPEEIIWTRIKQEEVSEIKYRSKQLRFGNEHISENIYKAFGAYGPYALPPARHYKVFFIYSETTAVAKEKVEKHLTNTKGYSNLQAYSHLPLVYHRDLNLEIQNMDRAEEEVEKHLNGLQKEVDVQYFVFYISPYPKYGISEKQQRHYYLIKEYLLKRLIVSQVIVASGIKQNINLWIPNIAMAMVAKMGGIPWKIARESEKELIVGFGAFKSKRRKHAFTGSSFCFDNEGRFQEFDCWQEVYEWSFMGSLYQAILKYKAKNKGIRRIVIHYYKELNKKEFRQVDELLDRFQLDIPVIVVRINSTFRHKELIADKSHPYHLPMNATYYHLQYHDYLLYINEREREEMKEVKSAAYPLKVSLQSNRAGLFEDKDLVRQLMQQLYDFSLLHWRSINQPRLPVTIAYPQYLARIFPYFEAEILQDIGRTSLWFL